MKQEALSDVLSEFARTMVTDFPIQRILDHLVKRIVGIMPITGAGVTLISPTLEPQAIAASNAAALRFERLQTELGEGPCLAAYQAGKAISVPDLSSDGRFPKFSPRAMASGLMAVFAFPLRHGDVPLGALDLYRDSTGSLAEGPMNAAGTLAEVAGAYLINAKARADLQDSSDQSRHAALHDPLTGLPNRALLMERLEHASLRGRRSGRMTAVFFIDLDRFKAVNDAYGHRVGDELLIAVGARLTGVLRPGDSLARLSGDEFVVLCEDLDDVIQADAIADRFHAALALPFALSKGALEVQASIGIAFSGGDDAPEELIHDADLAMYRRKRSRGGAYQDFELQELRLGELQASLASSLPGASGRGELHLAYQPIVDTVDGRLTGVEALMRWTHASRGSVAPTVFIPFAEQSGQIVGMGRWALQQAWRDRQLWQRQRAEEIAVSVNISAHQLMSAGFVDDVVSVLDTVPADPRLLTLEMTETVFVRDSERALIVLDQLKAIGIKLALDDFGTGYSSLSYLKALPIDAIKVDQSFIANLADDAAGQTILTAIIELAHGLGMTVVAEGVETAEQQQQLATLGSDSCQGFYFARPMPALSLETLLKKNGNGGNPHLPIARRARRARREPVSQLRTRTE